MNDSWTERLSEYLDGELATEERTLCEAHVATCAQCTDALAGLRDVVARARALPETPPAEDLWPGIAARIAAFAQDATAIEVARAGRSLVPAHRSGARAHARSFSFTWPQLAAAGIALVALSASASWFAAGRMATQGGGAPGPIAGVEQSEAPGGDERVAGRPSGSRPSGGTTRPGGGRTSAGGTVSAAAEDPAQMRYDATVADLQRELDRRRDDLDPQTVATIESNLKIIDLAATQARKALEDDPSNPYLKEHLSKTMQRKVDLLREATTSLASSN